MKEVKEENHVQDVGFLRWREPRENSSFGECCISF